MKHNTNTAERTPAIALYESAPPLTRGVLEALHDRNLAYHRLGGGVRRSEDSRWLDKVIAPTRSGEHVRMTPGLAKLLGIETEYLGSSDTRYLAGHGKKRANLTAVATPAAVIDGVSAYVAENYGISPYQEDPQAALNVAGSIRAALLNRHASADPTQREHSQILTAVIARQSAGTLGQGWQAVPRQL